MSGWSGALSGVTVLDMGHLTAGPLTSWFLGSLGATVIKVERPGRGEGGRDVKSPSESADADGYYFHSKNADKRSVAADLKSEGGRDLVYDLVADADVVVENFAPGKMASLELGYEDLEAHNESLVYCSVTGFGHDNREKDERAYDSIMQALSGVMTVTGTREDPPTRLGASVMDNLAGYVAATSILAALRHRSRTGEGQFVDVSMQDCAAWLVQARLPFANERTDHGPAREPHVPGGVFLARDGWVAVQVADDAAWKRFVEAVPASLPECEDAADRAANAGAIEATVTDWTAGERAAAVVSACRDAGVGAAVVATVGDVVDDDQLAHRAAFATVDGRGTAAPLPASPYATATDDLAERPSEGGPAIGEHTDEVLAERLGYDDAEIERLREAGAVE